MIIIHCDCGTKVDVQQREVLPEDKNGVIQRNFHHSLCQSCKKGYVVCAFQVGNEKKFLETP